MKKKPQAETQGRQVRAAKPKAGLSFSERKRLMELKRTLSGNSKKQEKPTTAQNTITFKKMFQDGICQVTSTFYTKMVEFFDINYNGGYNEELHSKGKISITPVEDED